jgi:hypothetical protein
MSVLHSAVVSVTHEACKARRKAISISIPPPCFNSHDYIDNENVVQGIKYLETRGMIWVK